MMAGSGRYSNIQTDNCADWSVMAARVNSFRNFPCLHQVSAERLARAGFYFTGDSDRVRCFSCQQTVENWRNGDVPVERHQQASPDCKFLSCTHRLNPAPPIIGSAYDEEAEDMEYRLRTGEVVDESTYPLAPHMCSEDARLRTFGTWPLSAPVRPRELAQAGLYHLGEQDRVRCFCCGGRLGAWEPGDEAWKEHERHYPHCFFILGHDVGNQPSQVPPERAGCPPASMESFEARLQSFNGMQHPVDHERLARAGFYSTGVPDRVQCFRCGGGLKDWQPEEDPWEEHAKHYPGCSFLLEEKGPEFVSSVQLRDPRRSSPTTSHQNGFSREERGHNVMQSEIAQKAVDMGMDPTKVERTILEKIRRTGEGYATVELLIEDIFSNAMETDVEESQCDDDEDPMEKLRKLQREKQCKVCMDRDISIVFIPCGHLVTCKNCSESLSKCPICCAVITQKIKTYIS
ncbi:E3 ubiquitin-protein ligase XIAP [Megalops cyprinoides]|uniref:E3 ubiquitin-protein ligase XIAP n=1 Tax=Megalops cyprinoides TaxID=118141 RepID=UPI0018642CEC|nr:E3 ubiquitin-protein ligase XIAP [Megalops cyprinoides]